MSLLERRRKIIILISIAVILVLLGITGIGLITSSKINIAKSTIDGLSTEKGLLEVLEDEDENEDEGEENSSGLFEDLTPEEMEQLQYVMMKTGIGYENDLFDEWKDIIKDPEEGLKETDEDGEITTLEKLWMLYIQKDEEERPEYLKNPDDITIGGTKADIQNGLAAQVCWKITLQIEYNGKTFTSKPVHYLLGAGSGYIEEEEIMGEGKLKIYHYGSEDEAREEAFNDLYEQLKSSYENSDWVKWSKKRNTWIENNADKLKSKEIGNKSDAYFYFWFRIAAYMTGLSDSAMVGDYTLEGEEAEVAREVYDILHQQVYDEYDEEYSKIDNILREYIENGEYDFKETDPDDGNQGGSGGNQGGSGGNQGGSGGNQGGSGGNQGGSGGNQGGSGGNQGGTTEPEDPIPAELQKVELVSPKNGKYRAGQEIKFKATFDKNVYGTSQKGKMTEQNAPKLLIGIKNESDEKVENKEMKFEGASGKTITYTYIVEDGDNGVIGLGTGDNFKGTVYNVSGKKTDLTKVEEQEGNKEVVADTIAPEVEKIEIVDNKGKYKIGDEIEIKVTFTEKIYSNEDAVGMIEDTVPVLNMQIGEGEIKNPKIKTIGEKELTYSYVVEAKDRGELKIDEEKAFDGTRNVYDEVGNKGEIIKGVEITGEKVTINEDLTTIKLSKEETTLDLNKTKEETITATTEPKDAKITWSSSDEKVATVDENGKITGVAIGETTITATAEDGGIAECIVTVKDTTDGETEVKLNKENIELDLGGTKEEQLSATVTPNELEVTWTSSDEKIAKVDETGKVTGIKAGTAEITAKAKDGTKATCKVTVTDEKGIAKEPEKIEMNITNPTISMDRTKELQIEVKIEPEGSNTNVKLTYKSSNEKVATVDENGKVTIKEPGETIISVMTENGKIALTNLNVVKTIEEVEGQDALLGDVTKDKKVDSADLLMVQRYKAIESSEKTKIKHQDWKIHDTVYLLGDIDGDGIIDTTDILQIQRYIAYQKSDTVKEEHPEWNINS